MRSDQPWMRRFAFLLDAAIVVYGAALLVALLGAELDLGWLRVSHAAKPILVLALVVPTRLAIREPSWLQGPVQRGGQWLCSVGVAVARRVSVPAAVRDVAFILLVTRPAAFAVAFLVNVLFATRRPRAARMPFVREKFFEIFAAWDSGWYFDIAQRGYYFSPDAQSSIAFFPLYPLLMRAVAWPFGGSDRAIWAAGILISWVAFVAALLVLHRLTARCCGTRQAARRAVWYVAIFPFSFFFTRVYTESLFLLLTLLAVANAFESRWWRAGIWGGLAALTRPNGILIGVPLLCMALAVWPDRRELTRRLLPLVLVPLGLAAYCLYAFLLSGDPLAWLAAQRHWDYSLGHPPWRQLLNLISALEDHGVYGYLLASKPAPFYLFHGAVAVLFTMVTPFVFKRLGVPLGAYLLVSLLVPLTATSLQGFGRYSAVLFPVFMFLGGLGSRRLHEAILIVFLHFKVLFISLFVTWHPIY